MHLYSCSVLKRTSPLAVVSLGAYLSHAWYDALWMQCVHVIRAAASTQMTKWLGVSKQPTNRPVLFHRGSWEQQRRCLVSSASSVRCLPASSQQPLLMVRTTPCWTAVLISACVTHLLLVTLCCACLRAERDRGKCAPRPSVCVYKQGSRLQTGQHGTHHVEGQEAIRDTTCTCAAGVTSHQSYCKCAVCRMKNVSALY